MDIYQEILTSFLEFPAVHDFPEMERVVRKSALKQPFYWKLPVLACQAAGGGEATAIPGAAAIAALQIGIFLVDDILDEDGRIETLEINPGQAANLASAFQAIGLQMISNSNLEIQLKNRIITILNEMLLTIAIGQNWDIQNPQDEAGYWKVVRSKGSPLFGAALGVGALMAHLAEVKVDKLIAIGHLYGELIQIQDDLRDTLEVPATSDWSEGKAPLPILFAQLVDHPDRERFLQLRREITNPQSLMEAQQILVKCGAVSYCIDQLMQRHNEALKMLQEIKLPKPEYLESVLDHAIRPARKLLSSIQLDKSESL